ncbi:acyltransferase family protein [Paraburkholderia susongensis]|uniref:Peptidoglycan/LPS O-acetylase OafA/YrhL, contains acyltransferase and SGNH-hydrolase domains n=1 Tax=Paraburkholderia susongensis TaxID=1515439 RepID=A0A1X7LQX7_9BURK|nr:acyltransferase [Paraburkholderia susongensis]SMG55743.1 Peptidoglycan/LPS O-acetylase OafA/YrhL, contains acyltransferase and SGNH-hydrolase domains [Paraburkholderia susongensis]
MTHAASHTGNPALHTDRPTRIVALDGLRAVAVLMVFLHHSLHAPFFWGVDLFFVISGFLITGILLERKARGQSYFTYFYARRVRRILPPFVLLLVVSSLLFGVGWIAHWPWYAFFAVNIGATFGQMGHESLSILWSLSVEEQFYLLWPFVVLLASERALMWIAGAALFVAPLLRFIATPWFGSFEPIYMLTPFRMDTLCAGALLAVLVRRDPAVIKRLAVPAIVGIVVALGVLGYVNLAIPRFRWLNLPWGNALLYSGTLVVSASIVILAMQSQGIVQKVLRHPVLVYIGTISYSFYLIHTTALSVMLNLPMNRFLAIGFALALTLAYSSLSWVLLEKRMIMSGRARGKAAGRAVAAAYQTE